LAQTADSARTGLFITSRAAITVAPVLCAAAYPTLSQLLSASVVAAHGSTAPTGIALWVSVVASLALALGVMAISFMAGAVAARLARHTRPLRRPCRLRDAFPVCGIRQRCESVARACSCPAHYRSRAPRGAGYGRRNRQHHSCRTARLSRRLIRP